MTFFPSACIWTCKEDPKQVLRQIKETAFHYVDVTADFYYSTELMEQAQTLGLKVGSVILDGTLSPGKSQNGKQAATGRSRLERLRQVLEKGAALLPQAICLAPCTEAKQAREFGSACTELAREAAKREVRVCVENHPRSAMPAAGGVLRFLGDLNHPNLYLVLDTGHSLLARENIADAIVAAGARLGAIQFNDNNGKSDKHWALLEGKLTEDALRAALQALSQVGYQGVLSIEVKWDRASVISGLSKNRNLLLRLQEAGPIKSMIEPEQRRKN